ncbi:MAG: NUDIX hydrolase [Caldilineaceae bacterium]
MNVSEQGTEDSRARYQVVPRTLVFVTSENPQNGETEVLLLRGAPDKRLWANRFNGLGGHVEAGEDVLAAARRELREEAGLAPQSFELRGVINVNTVPGEDRSRPGVVIFVFRARSELRKVSASTEGLPQWIAVSELSKYPLVDDLVEVIPRTLSDGPMFFGHYAPRADGTLLYRFSP